MEVAYNDPAGYTRAFEEHGWKIVQRELGLEGDAGVEFVGRYNEVLGEISSFVHVNSADIMQVGMRPISRVKPIKLSNSLHLVRK